MKRRVDFVRKPMNVVERWIGGSIESDVLLLFEGDYLELTTTSKLLKSLLDVSCQPDPSKEFHLHNFNLAERGL